MIQLFSKLYSPNFCKLHFLMITHMERQREGGGGREREKSLYKTWSPGFLHPCIIPTNLMWTPNQLHCSIVYLS